MPAMTDWSSSEPVQVPGGSPGLSGARLARLGMADNVLEAAPLDLGVLDPKVAGWRP